MIAHDQNSQLAAVCEASTAADASSHAALVRDICETQTQDKLREIILTMVKRSK